MLSQSYRIAKMDVSKMEQNGQSVSESTDQNGRKSNDHRVIEMPADNLWSGECSIYSIPKNLRSFNEAAYTPQLISIGPLHRDKLPNMKKHKSIYFNSFLARTEIEWPVYFDFIGKRQDRIRARYLEAFDELDRNDFITMFLWDSFFIFELFLRDRVKSKEEYKNDHLLHKLWLKNGIQLDLIRLENQLPYPDLLDLYNFAFHHNPKPSFYAITCEYFSNYNKLEIVPREQEVLHFTDLVRRLIIMGFPGSKRTGIENLRVAAKKLSDSGIKFKGIENGRLSDVQFDKGELRLPKFEASDTTECIYRNLMALEQCQYPGNAYICSYILLMDFLINNSKDAALLIEKEVIVSRLGSSQAVADMVNKLCRNIVDTDFYFQYICDELNQFCDNRWNRWLAILRGVYFSDIWHGTGTVVGLFVLGLTFFNSMWNVLRISGVVSK